MSKVYFVPLERRASDAELRSKVEALFAAADFGRCFCEHDLTPVKLHVGEPGTKTFTSPALARELVRLVARSGAVPFLTDTAVLYRSRRDNGPGHARVAAEHGFTIDAVGAPFIPADGLRGSDEVEVAVGGRHYDQVAVASAIAQARSLLVLSHATGHLGTGFGGALKNLGMGCASRKGKLRQHHGQHPRIDPGACRVCGTCAEWCPTESIEVGERTAVILEETCIGCGECIAACLEGAVKFDWSAMGRQLQERIVEHAAAIVRTKAGRIAFVTDATAITKDCDCLGLDQEPLIPDLGLLASHDPVAIDQAVLELVRERAGNSLEALSYPDRDARFQIEHAVAMGLGESRVELVTVGA
jgi:uncharacterized Fe-S center protein